MNSSNLLLSSVIGVLAFSASTAHAWEHIGVKWADDRLPIEVFVADDGAENTIEACEASEGLSGCCEETVPQGYCLEAVQQGYAAWLDAECADLPFIVADSIANPELTAPNLETFVTTDFYSHVVFNDPGDDLPAMARAAQLGQTRIGATTVVNGLVYGVQVAGDVAFQDNMEFIDQPAIRNGECADQASMLSTMVHEIGHNWGMAHSCENPDEGAPPCLDVALQTATMFYTGPNCDESRVTINEDDIEGITNLYGPSGRFECSGQVADGQAIGVVPFTINCTVVSDFINEVTDVRWRWGDGEVENGLTASHTYTVPGNYNVDVVVTGAREACGPEGWSNSFRRVGYVRACGVPEAAFEVEQVDGLRYEFLNDSDVSIYGCLSDIQWDIFQGETATGEPFDTVSAWEPTYEFPEPGTYTVVLSLGGIGGAGGASATFDVSRSGGTTRAFSCNTAPAGTGAFALILVGLLAARRRR